MRPSGRVVLRKRRPGWAGALTLALVMLLAAPLGALMVPGGPLGHILAPLSTPAPADDVLGDLSELPANDLRLARRLVLDAASAAGLTVTSLPLPVPSAIDPLHHALRQWLNVQHGAAADLFMSDALDQAGSVPVELREPLALLVLAHAQATLLQREALVGLSAAEKQQIAEVGANSVALAQLLAEPPAWMREAAAKVDLAKSVQAAVLLLDAAHEAYPRILEKSAALGAASGPELAPGESGPLARLVPVLSTAPEAQGRLEMLDDVLAWLTRERVEPVPAIRITQQMSTIAQGLGPGGLAFGPRASAYNTGPPGTSMLPENFDLELGRLLVAARVSVEVLATHGPEALAVAHLLRVRSMEAALPTLETWARALELGGVDTRVIAQPQLAAGGALARASDLPAPGASVAQYVAFGLKVNAPASYPAAGPDVVGALDLLYGALGRTPEPGWQATYRSALSFLDEDEARAISTLARGTADATLLANRALLRLSPQEAQRLQAGLPLLARFLGGETLPPTDVEAANGLLFIASEVDVALLGQALLTLASATDTARALLPPLGVAQPAAADDENCRRELEEFDLSDCDNGIYFKDLFEFVFIGGPGPSSYSLPNGDFSAGPPLLVDLGGDDRYEGSVACGSFFPAVSLGFDLGGRDTFTAEFCSQGAGILGAGLMVQAGGDTSYSVGDVGQGFGSIGAGALVDLGGNDTYRAGTGAQGSGFTGLIGLGLLAEPTGDDSYTTGQGVGSSLAGVFVDIAGKDTYRVGQSALGVRLDQPLDSDYVADSLFSERHDNALWLDGRHVLDYGFGLDVDAIALDHDADLFPTLVEILASSDSNDADSTPLTAVEESLTGLDDSDEDGSLNLLEEAAGTNADNATEAAVSLPSDVPLVPEEIAQLYRDLRKEHSEAPPAGGLILDVRMPFAGRTGVRQLCLGLGVENAFEVLRVLCADIKGPDDDELQESEVGAVAIGGIDFSGEVGAPLITAEATSSATLGLVAVGDVLPSTYEIPYLLSIDLGGDDVYLAGAGGAAVIETEVTARRFGDKATSSPLAFLPLTHLDLSGNDTYLGDAFAVGAGGGLAVDLGGSDRYDGGFANQGAIGGVLFDATGDDTYRAESRSQGAALPAVTFGWPRGLTRSPVDPMWYTSTDPLLLALANAHSAVSPRTLQPSLLLDARGDDSYEAGSDGQGYAAVTMALSPADTSLRPSTNGTTLLGWLLDGDGNDTYLGEDRVQGVAGPGGIALFTDRAGNDTYNATDLVSQGAVDARALTTGDAKLPGLALLTDAGGADHYFVRPLGGGLLDRTESREDRVTEQRVPFVLDGTVADPTDGQSLGFLEAIHADLEGSDRDSDGDGWPDALETALGTWTHDPEDAPAPATADTGAMLVNLPAAGLAIGGLGANVYRHDYVLTIDVGGANTYLNNAGGPLLKPLARLGVNEVEGGVDASAAPVRLRREAQIFQNPVTAAFNVGLEGATFRSARDLAQGASLFTVGLVVTTAGHNTFLAPLGERSVFLAPEAPKPRVDGVIAPSEWPVVEDITWAATAQEGLGRPGRLALLHDGEFLYVAARIPDPSANQATTPDEFRLYFANNSTRPTLIDRVRIIPRLGGTPIDQYPDSQGITKPSDKCTGTLTWCDDEREDLNKTSARMAYAGQGWTLELARPLELRGRPRVVPVDEEWPTPEDVKLTKGNLSGIFLEFIDHETGEVWRYPEDATASDGEQGFEGGDKSWLDEAKGWRPFFIESPVVEPRSLIDGPRVVQGASIAGVSVVAAVSALHGHDTYQAFEQAQGYGIFGGIGVLADLGGSDTYESRSWAQGAARELGFGILFDHDGNDIYRARDRSQGHSSDPIANTTGSALVPITVQLARAQPRGSLLDLGGYDRYDYKDLDAKRPLVALRAKDTHEPYVTYPDNDVAWTQARGGVGLDTFLLTFPQHVLGVENEVNVGDECVPVAGFQVCGQPTPQPRVELDFGNLHLNRCRLAVPYTLSGAPFSREDGALVLNGTMCLEVAVSVVKDRGFVPERIELLRSGERFEILDIQPGAGDGIRDGVPVDVFLYQLSIDTRQLPDGAEDWRVVAYIAADTLFQKRELFVSQANENVLLSNPPLALKVDAKARAFSPRPAIGSVGLPVEVRISHDVSEDRLERAGYIADLTNVPCPFQPSRLCNRYPLYLKGAQRLEPGLPDDPVPSGNGVEEVGWGATNATGDPTAGATFRHTLFDDVLLTGLGGIGFVAADDADVGRTFLATSPGYVRIAWAKKSTSGATFGVGDLLLVQRGTGTTVATSDLRLTPYAGRPPGTAVQDIDGDKGILVRQFPATAQFAYYDADEDGQMSPGDTLYFDQDADLTVTPAVGNAARDVRVTSFGVRIAGSFALPQDPDIGLALKGFDVPEPPDHVRLERGPARLSLSWDAPPGPEVARVTSYRVYRAVDAGAEALHLTLEPNVRLQVEDDEIGCGSVYTYRVAAISVLGEGYKSYRVAAREGGCPTAPRNLAVVTGPGSGELLATWDPPADDGGVDGVVNYVVQRGGIVVATLPADQLSFQNSGLGDGVQGCYRVLARTATTDGPLAAQVCATTFPATAAPGAPQALRLFPGPDEGQITVTWDPPAGDGNLPITRYVVYRRPASPNQFTAVADVPAPATTFFDAPPPDPQNPQNTYQFCYKVAAVNALGEGLQVAEECGIPAVAQGALPAPTGSAAGAGDAWGEVDVSWDRPTPAQIATSTQFLLYRDDDVRAVIAGAAGTGKMTFTDGGLLKGTYCYQLTRRVPAQLGSVEPALLQQSDFSVEACASPPPIPSEPLNPIVTPGPGNGEILVAWEPPFDSQGFELLGYRIFRDGPLVAELGATYLEFQDSGLADGQEFCYTVRAFTPGGESADSDEVCDATFSVPVAPAAPAAEAGPGRGRLTARWSAPTNDGGAAITAYRVYREDAFVGELAVDGREFLLQFIEEGFGNDVRGCYKISAVNAVGEGLRSVEVCATTFVDPLTVPSWRAVDVDGPNTFGPNDVPYIDVDGDGRVGPGDGRLSVASHLPTPAARLVFYHQPYFTGDVGVHAALRTGRIPTDANGDPVFTSFERKLIAPGQPRQVISEAVGRAVVSPLTPSVDPGGGELAGWSNLWLPFDDTRTYPGGPPAALGSDRYNAIELEVRTALVSGNGQLSNGCKSSPVQVGPLACGFWDEQNPSIVDCTLQASLTNAGLCTSSRFANTDLTPSRLELYVPTETDMFVRLNVTGPDGDERRAVEQLLEGGVNRRISWAPGSSFENGYYSLNLSAYDLGAKIVGGNHVIDQRWAPRLPGERVLLDGTAPATTLLLGPYVGTTQIDPTTESFKVRWQIDDGEVSSGIDELRIYAAPEDTDAFSDFKLVSIVKNLDRDGVDFVMDGKHDTFTFVAIARDEVGNIEGMRTNFWPSHRCPTPLPPGLSAWPPATGAPGTPSLDIHCFERKADAVRGAFQVALKRKLDDGLKVTTTVDTSIPVIAQAHLVLPDGSDLPLQRIGTRQAKAMAAATGALVDACVEKAGPSSIAQVNFFMVKSLDDGATLQRKARLNATSSGCYDFKELARWTRNADLYPEGFWTAGIEALDGAGNIAQSSFGVIYLDASPPVIAEGGLVFPHGQTAIVRGQELTVDADAVDATEVVAATIAAPRLNATGTLDLKVGRTGTVQGRIKADLAVPDGVYPVFVNITDALGNVLVHRVEVPVDSTPTAFVDPPELTTGDPGRAGEGVPASALHDGFGLTFTTTTPSRYQVLAGTNPTRLALASEHLGAFNTTHEALVTGLAPSAVYFVRVDVWSPGGIRASTDLFQVRTGASFALDVLYPRPGDAIGARASVHWVTAQIANGDAPTGPIAFLVSLRRSPESPWEVVGGTTGTLGPRSLKLDAASLPNGRTYGLRLEAALGRERAAAIVQPITLDKEAPVALLIDPPGGWTSHTQPELRLELSDTLSGVAASPVESVRIDDREAGYALASDGRTLTVTALSPLSPGPHTLVLRTMDAALNVAETLLTITVDITPPRLRLGDLDDPLMVRPGEHLVIELFGEDDGELALAEARLGDSVVRVLSPRGRVILQLPAPDALSARLPLFVRLVDAAGNQAMQERDVVLDATPPRVLDIATTHGLTGATLHLEATEPVFALVQLGSATFEAGPASTLTLDVGGLAPGRAYALAVQVRDRAGNALTETVVVTTLPDLVDPGAPPAVLAQALGNGTVALTWDPASDNAGIARYDVGRALSTGDIFVPLAATRATQFVDSEARPGIRYRYEVRAVDVAGRASAGALSGMVVPVAAPHLLSPALAPEIGTAADTFTFRVLFSQPGGSPPDEVVLVLDGARVPLEAREGSVGEGLAYQVTIPVRPHGPDGPHLHHFEARTAGPSPRLLRLPVAGEFEGPLVTVLGNNEAGDGAVVALKATPVDWIVGLVALGAGALVALRRSRP